MANIVGYFKNELNPNVKRELDRLMRYATKQSNTAGERMAKVNLDLAEAVISNDPKKAADIVGSIVKNGESYLADIGDNWNTLVTDYMGNVDENGNYINATRLSPTFINALASIAENLSFLDSIASANGFKPNNKRLFSQRKVN
jgi:hypothetical protein